MYRIILLFAFSTFVLNAQTVLQPQWQTSHLGEKAFYAGSGAYAVTQSLLGFSVWNTQTGALLHNITAATNDYRIADSIIAFYLPNYGKDSIEVWNYITGKRLYAVRANNAQTLALDKRGKKLAFFHGGTVEVRDSYTGEIQNVFSLGSRGTPGYIAFNYTGDFVIMSSLRYIDILDLSKNTAAFINGSEETNFPIAFSESDNTFFVWNEKLYQIDFWDAETKEKVSTLQISNEYPFGLGFPTKDNIMTFFSGSIRLWDFRKDTILKYYKGFKDYLVSIRFSADNSLMIATSKSEVLVWDVNTTILLTKLTIEKFSSDYYSEFNDASISTDNNQILVSLNDNNTHIVNRADKKIVRTIKKLGHYSELAYNKKSNEVFALLVQDGTIQKWDALTGVLTDTIRSLPYILLHESDRLSNDGSLIGSLSIETLDLKDSIEYYIMSTAEKKIRCKIRIGTMQLYIPDIVFSETGKKIALQTKLNTISLYDDRGNKTSDLELQTHKITKYTFGGSDDRICTTPDSMTSVTVWDVETGTQINTFNGILFPNRVFNKKGDRIITHNTPSGNTTHFNIWNTHTGELVRSINIGVSCNDVQFHPVSDIIIAWGKDNYIRAFDPNTGLLLYTLTEKTNKGFVCGNSAPILCTIGVMDNKSYLWDVEKGNPVAELGGHRYGIDKFYFSEDDKIAVAIGVEGLMSQWSLDKVVVSAMENSTTQHNTGTEMYLTTTSDNLTISFSQPIEQFADYSIYNVMGEKIHEGYFIGSVQSQTISLPHFGNGIYFFETEMNGKGIGKKFVIMR